MLFTGAAVLLVWGALLNPMRGHATTHFHARVRLWKTLVRLFQAPFKFVHFEDFFLGDQLTSHCRALLDLCYSLCFLVAGDGFRSPAGAAEACQGGTGGSGFVLFYTRLLPFVPYWLRFLQCLRRHRDNAGLHKEEEEEGSEEEEHEEEGKRKKGDGKSRISDGKKGRKEAGGAKEAGEEPGVGKVHRGLAPPPLSPAEPAAMEPSYMSVRTGSDGKGAASTAAEAACCHGQLYCPPLTPVSTAAATAATASTATAVSASSSSSAKSKQANAPSSVGLLSCCRCISSWAAWLTHKRFHHLHNAAKYFCSMMVALATLLDKGGTFWVASACIATSYSFFWDMW